MIVPGHSPGSRYEVPSYAIGWACSAAPDLAPHLLALAALESGFNPDAVANTACPDRPGYRPPSPGTFPEYSLGLLQLNACGGLGGSACCGLSPEAEAALLDPINNLRIGADAIRQRLANGATLYDALSPWYNARNILAREGWFSSVPENPCAAGGTWNGGGNGNGTVVTGMQPLAIIFGLLVIGLLLEVF